MGEYLIGVLLGLILGCAMLALAIANDDMRYDEWETRMEKIKQICKSADSIPRKFSFTEITCENGAKFSYEFTV